MAWLAVVGSIIWSLIIVGLASILLENSEQGNQQVYHLTDFKFKHLNKTEKNMLNITIHKKIKQAIATYILFEEDLNNFVKIYTRNNYLYLLFPKLPSSCL